MRKVSSKVPNCSIQGQEIQLFWQEPPTKNTTFAHLSARLLARFSLHTSASKNRKKKKTGVPHYLVDKADGWSLAAVQEVNVYDLQLLQSDVEGLELAVVSVQGNHFEKAVIQPQADHTTLWVDDADDTSF